MKTLIYLLVAIISTLLNIVPNAQAQTISLLTPIQGGQEKFTVITKRTHSVDAVLVISTSTAPGGTGGYTPVYFIGVKSDTNKLDTILIDKLSKSKLSTQYWVKAELLSSDTVSLIAGSNTGTVTVQPKPLQPKISYKQKPYLENGKIYAEIELELNVVGKIRRHLVFNASDTLGTTLPSKMWYENPQNAPFISHDSTYKTVVSMWMKHDVLDTIEPSLSASTKWVYVTDQIIDPKDTTTIVDTLSIDTFFLKSRNGGDISLVYEHRLKKGTTGLGQVDYDRDGSFDSPIDWTPPQNLTSSGTIESNFTGLAPGTYWARVQINDGTSWVTKKIQFQIWAVGIDEVNVSRISVYPNPTSDFLNVPSITKDEHVVVYNMSGRVVLQTESYGSRIDVSKIPVGINFIKTESGQIFRFIKN